MKKSLRFFPKEEYDKRRKRVRDAMAKQGLDACLIVSPENIYYLCGLNHMGYFAFQMLIFPLEGQPVLVTRAMEKATVRDIVVDVKHVGYSDGNVPLPPPEDDDNDIMMAKSPEDEEAAGLEPWTMSFGIPTRKPDKRKVDVSSPVQETLNALKESGLESAHLGLESTSSFLPYAVAQGIVEGLPKAEWTNASGLVNDCRIVQSPLELKCTREAAEISDAMMLSAIAAAGRGIHKRDVMAAIYEAMFRRGGTYPGFVPLVRSTRTLEHEHGTWDDTKLMNKDILFLEMAGCMRRYHAPIGRLVFIGKASSRTHKIHAICEEALNAAAQKIAPGIRACEVYRVWQGILDKAGLSRYKRHHCGYVVGIGFPPSWSGGGVPLGLRANSEMELKPGMVFHLMSWLLRTGQGDSFLSDTVVVTETGCELLTNVSRALTVR